MVVSAINMGILRSSSVRNLAIRSTLGAVRALPVRADGTDGVALDPFLPSSYKGLLAWQTADELVTTTDSTANTDLSTWTPLNQSAPVGGKPDPFGGNDAWELTETAAAAAKQITMSFAVARQNGETEIDIYVKRGVVGTPAAPRNFAVGRTGGESVIVDLSTGAYVVGTPEPYELVSVTSAGGGWWRVRCTITFTAAANIICYITGSNSSVTTTAGDGTSSIFVYSPYYARQRRVDSFGIKEGTATVASSQGTAANKPFLMDSVSLGGLKVIGSYNPGNTTKSLTDDPAIAAALAGSDKPFSVVWLGRTSALAANNWMRMAGAASSHTLFSTTATSRIGMSRTDDAAATVTPVFAATDFTADRNWHAFALIFNGTSAELWIDGAKSASSFAMNVGVATFTSFVTNFVSCYLRERAIYSVALTTQQHQKLSIGMAARANLPTFDYESPLNIPGVQSWHEAGFGITTISATVATDMSTWTPRAAPNGLTGVSNGDGTYNLTEGAGVSTEYYLSSPTNPFQIGTAIFSVELKQAPATGRQWVALVGNSSSATTIAFFDLTNGVVGTTVGCTPSITDMGGGWYKCTIIYPCTFAAFPVRIYSAEADNDTTLLGSGAVSYVARNPEVTQNRVSKWYASSTDRINALQVTNANQPMYFSASYVPLSMINSLGTVGESADLALKTLTLTPATTNAASYSGVWTGEDSAMSVVGLYNKTANPTTTYNGVSVAGATAVHQLCRVTNGGNFESLITDNAAATVNPVQGAIANGAQTISQIFTGTAESVYLNGAQLGASQALDVGTCTFGTSVTYNARTMATRGFTIVNRQLTSDERTYLETGFNRRAGLI
jgi:hypothetical protein